ncbi:hypothetical protein NECAME_14217 [Necator americanus]|uniref:Uncharacterized protein n=1 Tax=Necator americanus TaxID=51031 RepID=W2SRG9_NECAM|nr:hypothetical protein NECAME_14217 [Necator americanus]ETN71456.1 hypothetical protein NECAME_14217 [Necator americanus]
MDYGKIALRLRSQRPPTIVQSDASFRKCTKKPPYHGCFLIDGYIVCRVKVKCVAAKCMIMIEFDHIHHTDG